MTAHSSGAFGLAEFGRRRGQVVWGESMGREKLRRPGDCFRGGTDDEFAAGTQKEGGSFDHESWRAEAARRHQIGSTSILLLSAQTLGGGVVDGYSARPSQSGAVQFQKCSFGQRGFHQCPP